MKKESAFISSDTTKFTSSNTIKELGERADIAEKKIEHMRTVLCEIFNLKTLPDNPDNWKWDVFEKGMLFKAPFVLKAPIKMRIICRRVLTKDGVEAVCDGIMEGSFEDFNKAKFDYPKCPKCQKEFCSGRRFMLSGDQIKVTADLLRQISTIPDFTVELVKEKSDGKVV